MSFSLTLPVNTALLQYILYCVVRIIFPSNAVPKTVPTEFKQSYTWMPKGHPPSLLFKTYTPKTLEPFNGQNGQRILLAIKGVVYDVTAGRNFYGPGTSCACYRAYEWCSDRASVKVVCTPTSLVEMHPGAWRSSLSTKVRPHMFPRKSTAQ